MKIGIISINAHTKVLNFASPLHTYAFWEFLHQNGIESTIIDYKPCYYGEFDARHPLYYYQEHPMKSEKKQEENIEQWSLLFKEREKRFDRFEEFIEKYYKKTDRCYTAKIIEDEDPGFDCYICATDIIWKYNPNTGFDRGFLLACQQMAGKKKIAYSASRGAKEYTSEQEREFLQYIGDFDAISVREDSLKEYIKETAGLDVPHILDPVFLHEADFYRNLAVEPKEQDEYILVYVVMQHSKNLLRDAKEFAQQTGRKIILLSDFHDDIKRIVGEGDSGVECQYIYDIGVEEWLGYMDKASYIFTNSFHACCFSIILQKQFFVGLRAGDKIDSLLAQFDLTWRRTSIKENGKAIDMKEIDFAAVDAVRCSMAQKSKDFILQAIRDVEKKDHTPLIPDMDAFLADWDRARGPQLRLQEKLLCAQKENEKISQQYKKAQEKNEKLQAKVSDLQNKEKALKKRVKELEREPSFQEMRALFKKKVKRRLKKN